MLLEKTFFEVYGTQDELEERLLWKIFITGDAAS